MRTTFGGLDSAAEVGLEEAKIAGVRAAAAADFKNVRLLILGTKSPPSSLTGLTLKRHPDALQTLLRSMEEKDQ